ncbi:MAG: hypothetical protein VKP63_07475 [Cyanobacteriota bacterium]|nr:hypothetical protein [Cyanobacteriota bacterium]
MTRSTALAPLLALLAGLLLIVGTGVAPVWAGPVSWREVPATAEGRQWWDAGSLRLNRQGRLSVLSRFQPPAPPEGSEAAGGRPPASTLYVMELDCDQELYRDISVNGLPRFQAEWQAVAGDSLSRDVLRAACRAAANPLAAAAPGAGEVVGG